MTFELMPEEPGDRLTEAYPGFTDRLMQRIEARERRQKQRRLGAIGLTMAFLAAGGYLLSTREADPVQPPAIAQHRPAPAATPVVQPAPVQQALQQVDSKPPATSPSRVAQGQQSSTSRQASVQHEENVITLDGKVLQGVKFENGQVKCTSQEGVKLVRDKKPVSSVIPVSTTTVFDPCKGSQ
jgi:hypothetical protein